MGVDRGSGGKSGRAGLQDVARLAGVGIATVDRVLNERGNVSPATARRVIEAARELGYRPDRTASLLARRRTQLLGVTMDVSSAFHAELLEDVHAAADRRGYDVVVSPVTRTHGEGRAVETLLDFRCEALLLLGTSLPEAELATIAGQHAVVAVGEQPLRAGAEHGDRDQQPGPGAPRARGRGADPQPRHRGYRPDPVVRPRHR